VHGPKTKHPLHLKGGLLLKINNFEPMVLPLEIDCELPRISHGKQLFSSDNGINVLKVSARKNFKISPLQFRNHSPFSLSFEVELAGPNSEFVVHQAYNLTTQANVNTLAHSCFNVNLNLIINDDFEGKLPET